MRLGALFAVLLTLVLARPAWAYGDCNDPTYLRTFDDRLRPADCVVIDHVDMRWSGGHANMRIVKQRGAVVTNAAAIGRQMREVAARVTAAMDAVGGLDIADVTVLLTDLQATVVTDDGRLHVEAWTRPQTAAKLSEECAITFFKTSGGLSPAEFVFTYALELFHCIQARTWRAQFYAGRGTWWIEGSAEYFAHLAQPGVASADSFIADFDIFSVDRSLLQMSYDNVVFFAWLTQTYGASRLRTFSAGMADRPSQQLAALQGQVSSDQFLTFAKAYLDKRIKLPGGRALPSIPVILPTLTIQATRQVQIPAAPYQIGRQGLAFKRGHLYRVSLQGQAADFRMNWSKLPNGKWEQPARKVPACEEDVKYRMVWITTTSTSGGVMNVEAGPPTPAECNCLVGSWQMNDATLTTIYRLSCKRERCSHVGGAVRMKFNAPTDNNLPAPGQYAYDNLTFQHDGDNYRSTVTYNGTASFRWVTLPTSSTRVCTGTEDPASCGRSVVKIAFDNIFHPIGTMHKVSERPGSPPTVTDTPLTAGVVMGPFLGGRYTCSGTRLHFDPPPSHNMPEYAFDFDRVQ